MDDSFKLPVIKHLKKDSSTVEVHHDEETDPRSSWTFAIVDEYLGEIFLGQCHWCEWDFDMGGKDRIYRKTGVASNSYGGSVHCQCGIRTVVDDVASLL